MSDAASFEIVATLGPSSWNLAPKLLEAGANMFRLNASHMTAAEVVLRMEMIRRQLPGFPTILDLQGAKMRLGIFAPKELRPGEEIRFCLHTNAEGIPLPHAEIFRSVGAGDTLSCDDDRIRFRVETISDDALVGRAISAGTLLPRKGVNIVEHPALLSDLPDVDIACLDAAVSLGCSAVALSFMKDGSEADWVRRRAPGVVIAGKIERAEAAANLDAIASRVDSIWICRGDLGAQLGPASMARWVSACRPANLTRPVLIAGQVLEHMTRNAEPTRSEVCHLYDLVHRGYSGFVLSDETAIGDDPVRAVQALHALLVAFESLPMDHEN